MTSKIVPLHANRRKGFLSSLLPSNCFNSFLVKSPFFIVITSSVVVSIGSPMAFFSFSFFSCCFKIRSQRSKKRNAKTHLTTWNTLSSVVEKNKASGERRTLENAVMMVRVFVKKLFKNVYSYSKLLKSYYNRTISISSSLRISLTLSNTLCKSES